MSGPTQTEALARATLESRLAALAAIAVRHDEPLAPHTSMGVGGPARWFIEVEERGALAHLLALLGEAGVAWTMLGGGSNTLFEDRGFEGAVVHLGKGFRFIEADPAQPELIHTGSGALLSAAMNFAKRRGLSGLEFGAGIPGTLGGALAGNSGAGGADICSLAESVEVLDEDGAERTLARGEFGFSYRKSGLAGRIILAARLRLAPASREEIETAIQAHLAKRMEQPIGDRSSGCMFKNPPGEYAGRLIDAAGLKGLQVGGISVSNTHANFMINEGGGTAQEIRQLMEEVRRRVQEESGFELEAEVRWVRPSD